MKKELRNLIGIVLIIVVFDIGVKWLFWKIFKYVVLKIFFNIIVWNENVEEILINWYIVLLL